ncbi:MAG: hypothetical protein P4L86_27555, partial [Mycobacterium sp.]|nr:hypothetical protein [Mycobacterium sp.]
ALTAAGDPTTTPIIGLTYPDVILGEWVYPAGSPNQTLATDSVGAFKLLINPALRAAYTATAVGGAFVDVTAATGAYTPLTTTVVDPTYGTIPVAVADVCKISYFCSIGNIHANTLGYTTIGKLVVSKYKSLP